MDANETEIRHLLKELKKSTISEDDLGETAAQLVVEISEIIGSQKSIIKLELYVSLLFETDGLIDFCRSTGKRNSFIGAKESCISLFSILVENNSSIVLKYGVDIQKLCKFFYNVEKGVSIRGKSLELMCVLLLTYKRNLDVESLKAPAFVQQIVLDLKNGKSLTLKCQQLKTLGVLCDVLTDEVKGSSSLIQKVLIENLSIKNRDARQDLTIASGALRGMRYYLNKFDVSEPRNLYNVMHIYMDPKLKLTRKDCQRAALELFHHHGSKFSEELMNNFEYLYNCLNHWCEWRSREDHRVAVPAMETFNSVIAKTLESGVLSEATDRTGKLRSCYMFFFTKYTEFIHLGGSSSTQLTIAVKGCGMLAGATKLFLGANALQKMFDLILPTSHHAFFENSEMLETRLANLPSYIETLGIILNKMDKIESATWPKEIIVELCLGLTQNFPYIFKKKRFLAYRAVFTLLSALKPQLCNYKEFTHSLVFETLVHSCSYPPPVDTDGEESSLKDSKQEWNGVNDLAVTYKNYISLWEVLLSPNSGRFQMTAENVDENAQITTDLYNEFIDSTIEIVDKIDLSIFKSDEAKESSEKDEFTCDPISGFLVKRPKHFQMYSNLAGLSAKLLPLRADQLDLRLPKLLMIFVRRSIDQPLVSIHYSMIWNLLCAANSSQYFAVEKTNEDKATVVHLLTRYGLETLERCKQYKDQLLVAALFLIFELPPSVVEKIFPHLIPAVQMALRMGLSYLPIAQMCVEAMEKWIEILPPKLIKEYYPSVLPLFMPYLRSQESYKGEISSRSADSKVTLSKQRRKVDEKKFNTSTDKNDSSEMLKVQLSIWRLLGRLDCDLCQTVVSEDCEAKAVAWDSKKHVKFSIPFRDVKLDVYLDEILPNTIDLAVGSTDRQTKVAACELLHSLVILMIGTDSQRSQATENKRPMVALYRHIFAAMFKLSCDSDSVTRQLFLTLTFQCIHWFTNNQKFEKRNAAVLLETIMNGLTEPNDPSLRDFSAKSLLEFYRWSEKQSKDSIQILANTKSVMKRITSFCRQPCAFKRLGGCLAWNSIYQEVRENEAICDIWTIPLLSAMFDCLQRTEGEDALLGTSDQCKLAIKHLERIIQKRRDLFSKSSPRRRLVGSCGQGTIDDIVSYLFDRVGCLNADTRHLAIELMTSLAPLCKGCSSIRNYIVENVINTRGKAYIIGLFEGPEHERISNCYKWDVSNFTYRLQVVYFKALLCSLDCYSWSLSLGFLSLADVAQESAVFTAIRHFVKTFALHKSEYSLKQSADEESSFVTTSELCKLDEMKCTNVIRLLNFLQTALQCSSSAGELLQAHYIWTEEMLELVLNCVFAPESVGFNVADTEVKCHLPLELLSFLKTFRTKINAEVFKLFQDRLFLRLNLKEFEQNLPVLQPPDYIANDFKCLISGLITVMEAKLIEGVEAVSLSKTLLKWIERSLYSVDNFGVWSKKKFGIQQRDVLQKCLQLAIAADNDAKTEIFAMATSTDSLKDNRFTVTGKGEYFLHHFGFDFVQMNLPHLSDLMNHCASLCKKSFSHAVPPIKRVLQFLGNNHDARQRYCNEVVISFLKCWPNLVSALTKESHATDTLLQLLRAAFSVDQNGIMKQHIHLSDADDTSVVVFYTNFLLDHGRDLNNKMPALKMLRFFLSGDEVTSPIVMECLQKFRALYLPLRSTEYKMNSMEDRQIDSVLSEILSALKLTSNTDLLGIVLSIFCQEDEHRYLDKLQTSLKEMTKCGTPTKQLNILNHLYEAPKIFTDQQYRCVELALMPCLQYASSVALVQFFSANISKIALNIEESGSAYDENPKIFLYNKIASFSLLQVMYCKLQRDQVFGPGADVNCAIYPNDATGKQLTKELIRASLRFAKKEMLVGTNHGELRRKCACAAYNTLIAILSNVNDQAKLFEDMLFSEKSSSGEDLFKSVLDLDKVFSFGMEVDFKPGASNRLIAVHQRTRGEESTELESPITYLMSRNLDGSSLREDASEFDFSTAVVLSQDPSTSTERRQDTSNAESTVSSINLDRSDFNDHEVMANLTALIQQLMIKNPVTDEMQAPPQELPKWMQFLKSKLDKHQPRNVKLFVLRLLTNTESAFALYSRHFIEPVLSCVNENIAGTNINYFVVDVLLMVISWGTVPEGSCDADIISKVFEFLLSNTPQLRADVFKYNLNVVRCAVETWKEKLIIPKDVIPRLLEVKHGSERQVEAGLQISGILLANGLSPVNCDCKEERKRFEKAITGLVDSHLSTVYVPASEVVGLYAHKLAPSVEDQTSFLDIISAKLDDMASLQPGKFVACLYFIQLRHPAIVKRFVNRLLNLTSNLFGINLERAFEIMAVNALQIENISLHLVEHNVQQLLNRKESNTQFAVLQFVDAVLPIMPPFDVKKLLPSITNFSKHTSTKCREKMYHILIYLYDNYINKSDSDDLQIGQEAQKHLLRAVNDPDIILRQSVINFWIKAAGTMSVRDRLLFVFEKLFNSESEDCFLTLATHILLQASHLSTDFQRPIFEHALTECVFREMKVSPGWKSRHASMVPLFTETQGVSDVPIDSLISLTQAGASDGPMVVQATQRNKLFTATQTDTQIFTGGTQSDASTYNWLTGTSLDVYLPDSEFIPSSSALTSGLLISQTQSGDMSRFKRPGLGKRTLDTTDSSNTERRKEFSESLKSKLIRRRFVKDQDKLKQNIYFARKEEMRKKMRESVERDRKSKREAQVTIYRQYRVGELPDIQIPYKAIIAPLQALAERDNTTASALFNLVSQSVYENGIVDSTDEDEDWKNRLKSAIQLICKTSSMCVPHVMRPVLNFCLSNGIHINPQDVAEVSMKSGIQPIGILALEQQLINSGKRDTLDPPHKKKRTLLEPVSDTKTVWLCVADLYKSLSMYDYVLGIFKTEIGSMKEGTKKALDAESTGDYYDAYHSYKKVLDEQTASEDEMRVAEEWCISAAEHLGQWSYAEKLVDRKYGAAEDNRLSSLKQVWKAPRAKSLFVPTIINSKLMKVLRGSSDDGSLCAFVNDSRDDPAHRHFLETELAYQLAVLAVNQEKGEEARALLAAAQISTLKGFANCSLVTPKSLNQKLAIVQPLRELEDFLILSNLRGEEFVSRTLETVDRWNSNQVTFNSSNSNILQFMTFSRSLFLHFLLERLPDEKKGALKSAKIYNHAEFACAALNNSNPLLSWKHIEVLKKIAVGSRESYLVYILLSRASLDLSKKQNDPSRRLSHAITGCKFFDKIRTCNYIPDNLHYDTLQSQLLFEICTSFGMLGDAWKDSDMPMDYLQHKFPNLNIQSKDAWCTGLLQHSYENMLNLPQAGAHSSKLSALPNSYNCMAKFCENSMKNWAAYIDKTAYSKMFIQSVLRSMAGGCQEAVYKFPRILNLIEQDLSLIETFTDFSKSVPVWKFLQWINHILIYVDKPIGIGLYDIIENIAKTYPQALFYSFEVCKLAHDKDGLDTGVKQFCNRIERILSDIPLLREFVTAVCDVHLPHLELKDSISVACKSKSRDPLVDEIRKILAVLDGSCDENQLGVRIKCDIYTNVDHLTECKKLIVKIAGSNAKNLDHLREAELKKCLQNVQAILGRVDPRLLSGKLRSYSPWLANLKSTNYLEEIEVPGQYCGSSKPLPEYHAKISSVDENVRIMHSLRVPIKLTIYGTNKKEYCFLLKYGEDLRTDQRIEQLFNLMNNIYSSAEYRLSCRPKLRTYSVIPLSLKTGLLQWVDGTQTLRSFIQGAGSPFERNQLEEAHKLCLDGKAFDIGPKCAGRPVCVKSHEKCVSKISWDLLRRGIYGLAINLEGFFHLRSRFVNSYATLCISHWLLGIGDRHLDNFLIDLKSGDVIGIDFGHHFETSTQFLRIPEIIPFRLTPQFVNVMRPLGTNGPYKEIMITCLASMAQAKEVILAAVEAFVTSPTEDWLNFISIQENSSDDPSKVMEFSAQRLDNISKKLSGAHPSYITQWAASKNHVLVKHRLVQTFSDVILGKGYSQRWHKAILNLTVMEQVEILIEQATDPNILGRTYGNWQPFI